MVLAELVAWALEKFGVGTVTVSIVTTVLIGLAIISHLMTAGTLASRGVSWIKVTLIILLVLLLLGLLDTQQIVEYFNLLTGADWSGIGQALLNLGGG